MTSFVSHTVR